MDLETKKNERKERILAFMAREEYKPLRFKELATIFEVPKTDIEFFKMVLEEMEIPSSRNALLQFRYMQS
jgi:hypothetical protein